MTIHYLNPIPGVVHGAFSRDLPPVLTIHPGDTVRFQTLDADWNLEPRRSTVSAEKPRQFEPRPSGHADGHALCGPVAIVGAEPGMTLAVHILDVVPGKWGFTTVGGWAHPVNDFLGTRDTGSFLLWDLDGEAMTGGDQYGHTVKLSPFMGVLGMPPAEPGMHSTVPPRITGGNLDCKELIAGSTLYLPIAVSGGLFSTGDGHARQGDGESSGTAIECPIARADLRFELLDRPALSTPCAQTPLGWLTFGLDEDLDQAALIALAAMVDLMIERFGLSRHQALGLASVVVDLRITQIVNGTKGVHAALSFESIDELGLEPV